LNISDTTAMLSPYLRKVDTLSLSNRINLKLNISDTTAMLSTYVNFTDTASMLSTYIRNYGTQTIGGAKTFSSTVTGLRFDPTGGTAAGNGMFLPAANTLGFSTDGGQRMTISSTGNVGINNTSPVTRLNINASSGQAAWPATSGTTQSTGHLVRLGLTGNLQILDIGVANAFWIQATNSASLEVGSALALNPNRGPVLIGKGATDQSIATLNVRASKVNQSAILYLQDTLDSPVFIAENNGQVGVKTIDPTRDFHVQGEIRVTDLDAGVLPTQIVGADANGVFDAVGIGTGLSISGGTLNGIDTTSLSNRIDTKLNASDTSKYVKYADTLTTIATKANLALKLNAADTASLSNRIDAKQNTLVNSAGLAAALSDEVGTGAAVFNTSPNFKTNIRVDADSFSTSSFGGSILMRFNGTTRWQFLVNTPFSDNDFLLANTLLNNYPIYIKRSNSFFGINNVAPQRQLHVTGEARITDLVTDNPTRIVGADADGDLSQIKIGTGIAGAGTDSIYFNRGAPVTVTTATYTVLTTSTWIIINTTGSGGVVTLTLPSASTYPGKEYTIKTIQAADVKSASTNIHPLNSDTATDSIVNGDGKFATLVSDGTRWVIMQAN
jgi:hypothetical protein